MSESLTNILNSIKDHIKEESDKHYANPSIGRALDDFGSGEQDAIDRNGFESSYDESCKYKGRKKRDYEEGYDEGYHDGYESGKYDSEEDGDDEEYDDY